MLKAIVILFLAATLFITPGASIAVAASNSRPADAAAGLPPPPITRIVNIDGRFVTVKLSVLTVIPGNIPENWPGPSTGVNASISIQDGALLPAGLKITRVRFERLYGNNRVFFAPLTQVATAPSDEFELDRKDYIGDITGRFGRAQRLRATVRLEIGKRVISVPFGTVRIGTLPLP